MDLLLGILALIGCIAVFILLVAAVALRFRSDWMAEHTVWPDEGGYLDEAPTLNTRGRLP